MMSSALSLSGSCSRLCCSVRHHGGTSDGQLAEQLIAPVRFVFMPREQLQYVLSEPLQLLQLEAKLLPRTVVSPGM